MRMGGVVECGDSHHYLSYMEEFVIGLQNREIRFLRSEARRLFDTYGINLSSTEIIHVLISAHVERTRMCPAFKDADREWLYQWLANSE